MLARYFDYIPVSRIASCQYDWNSAVANKRSCEIGSSLTGRAGQIQSFVPRLHRSHTLTLLHSLMRNPPPRCEHCQCNTTVRHILVEGNTFTEMRGNGLDQACATHGPRATIRPPRAIGVAHCDGRTVLFFYLLRKNPQKFGLT